MGYSEWWIFCLLVPFGKCSVYLHVVCDKFTCVMGTLFDFSYTLRQLLIFCHIRNWKFDLVPKKWEDNLFHQGPSQNLLIYLEDGTHIWPAIYETENLIWYQRNENIICFTKGPKSKFTHLFDFYFNYTFLLIGCSKYRVCKMPL